jgi:hypothetical protein
MMEVHDPSDIDIDGWEATMSIGGFEGGLINIIDINSFADINDAVKGSLGL